MKDLDLTIEGMHCQKCVERVKGALTTLSGVRVQNVEVGRAKVQYDEAAANADTILQAVDQAGYKAHPR